MKQASSHVSPQGEVDLMRNDNRQMLIDSVRDYVARSYDTAARAQSRAHPNGCVEKRWQDFAELGWLALPVPLAHGGLAGSAADVGALCEELGRGLVNEPFVASAVSPGALLRSLPASETVAQLQSQSASGSLRLALACWEPGHVFDTAHVTTQAIRDGATYRLQGNKAMVAGGAAAHAFIVPARISAARLGLFLVAADAPGSHLSSASLYDGQRIANVHFDDVMAGKPLFEGPQSDVAKLLRGAMDHAIVADCAQAVGTMQAAFDITLDYTRTRKQFGQAIAANQVVQHRLVDLYVELAQARALTGAAADMLDVEPSPTSTRRRRLVAAARASVALACKQVWQESVQLHGAIGMTQEYVLEPFVKRLALACVWHGSAESQLEQLAAASLDAWQTLVSDTKPTRPPSQETAA